MSRHRRWLQRAGLQCALSCVMCLGRATASAQAIDAGTALDSALSESSVDSADGAADASDEWRPGVLPPRAVYVPEVVLPNDASPLESVEALVVVDRVGGAQLEVCEDTAAVCSAIASALRVAQFEPARVAGEPRPARVRVSFRVRTPDTFPSAPPAVQPAQSDGGFESRLSASTHDAGKPYEYGAIARVPETPPTAHSLELAEMRQVPGAFGDPFRVLEALPGVVPVVSGLPFTYVRGAPPAATAYYFDGVQLPTLFHFALGPAVVHAAMVGPMDFYPGVAPARYGRKTGGVVAGKAADRPLRDGIHGELELRLVDLSAYVASPIGRGGRIEAGARYGFPGALTTLFEPRVVVQYWDYQLRAVLPVASDTEITLVALGSYDLLGERRDGRLERTIELQFHRVEARWLTRRRHATVGAALSAGFERSGLADDFDLTSRRVGPKFWFETRARRARLRLGADMLASLGHVQEPLADEFDIAGEGRSSSPPQPAQSALRAGTEHGFRAALVQPMRLRQHTVITSDEPRYANASTRNVIGAYAELTWPFAQDWVLDAGLRGDVWLIGGQAQGALEPRGLLRYQLAPWLGVHVAGGLAYQPAVFPVPLPGLSDVTLYRGLQRAVQSELGTTIALPYSLWAELKGYAHFYEHMLSFESLADNADTVCDPSSGVCREETGRMSAFSYGAEFLLRRSFRERFSGWLSYTLARADGRSDSGRELTPYFDLRHVGNLVLQWRINAKWQLAARGYVQSRRFPFNASYAQDPRERRRLPAFGRGDLQLARLWRRRWGMLQLTFDWLNFTFQREPFGWECPDWRTEPTAACKIERVGFPITLPMLGVRGTY